MPKENKEEFKLNLESKLEKFKAGEKTEKIKVLVLADSPTVVTGFANVCRNILETMYKTGMYDFEIVGINYDGSPHDYPYRIWPAINALMSDGLYHDIYGKQKFLDLLGTGNFDIAWVLQDTFIIKDLAPFIRDTNAALPPDKKFAFMYYFPIDSVPKKDWIDKSVMIADVPVAYTRYGYDEVMKLYAVDADSLLEDDQKKKNLSDGQIMEMKLEKVYHGTNLKDFFPIEDPEEIKNLKAQFWDQHKEKFVFINVNRNQPRKDLFRTLTAFKMLLDRRRAKGKNDVYLYIHALVNDNSLNLVDMGKQLGLTEGDEYAFPDPRAFSVSSGIPTSVMNHLYNAADCLLTTTLGEGWGLSLTEAMSAKIPVIAPDHTSIPEILGKSDSVGPLLGGKAERTNGGSAERGLLVKTNSTFVQGHDNSRIRPLTDVEDLVDKMEFMVENRAKLQTLVDRAYEWVKSLEWDGAEIGGKWDQLFIRAYEIAIRQRGAALAEFLDGLKKKENPVLARIEEEKKRREANKKKKVK